MLAKRREQIVVLVNQREFIHFSELTEAFPDVSEMTLRKDLKALDAEQRLVRIYGGARSISTIAPGEVPLSDRLTQNIEQKILIAQKAVKLVKRDATLFMDSGSTMVQLARQFQDVPCTVYTGGISVAVELSKLAQPRVQLLGGSLNKDSLSVRDPLVKEQIAHINFDLAFLAVNGFTPGAGFTCHSKARWVMEQSVIKNAARTVILMDSSKVGARQAYTIADPADVDTLISDNQLDNKTRELLVQAGVDIL